MRYTKESIINATEFAKLHNIPLGCLRYIMRYYNNEEFSDKLDRLLNLDLNVNGKLYDNLQDVLREYYLPIKSIDKLLSLGLTLECAVNMTVESRKINYNGVDYLSVKHLCKELNKNYKLVRDRVRHGWSLDKALETPKIERSSKKIKEEVLVGSCI